MAQSMQVVQHLTRRYTMALANRRLRSTASSLVDRVDKTESNANVVKSFEEMPGRETGLWRSFKFYTKALVTGSMRKPWKLFIKVRDEYGPIWKQRLGSFLVVFVADAKYYEIVARNEGRYPTRMPFAPWIQHRHERNLELGLLLLEGEDWHRNRMALSKRLLIPKEVAYHNDTVNDVITDMVNKLVRARDSHGNDNIVPDIENIMFKWTLDTACSVFLGRKLNLLDDKPHPEGEAFIQAVHDVFATTVWLFVVPVHVHKMLNTWIWKKHLRVWDTIYVIVKKLIDVKMNEVNKRLSAGEKIDDDVDFITSMAASGTLSIGEMYSNATELLAGAVDATSVTLLWVLYCVAQHPHVQERVYEEVKQGIPRGEIPTHEHIKQMPYLKAVVKETIRLHPASVIVSRIADKDITVGGYRIPAKTPIIGHVWLMSRDPQYFEDPLEFRPDRWLREENERFYGYKNTSFGVGPRMCIGKRLAELELHLALARICQQFILEPTTKVEARMTTLSYPDRPLNLKFINRAETKNVMD